MRDLNIAVKNNWHFNLLHAVSHAMLIRSLTRWLRIVKAAIRKEKI